LSKQGRAGKNVMGRQTGKNEGDSELARKEPNRCGMPSKGENI